MPSSVATISVAASRIRSAKRSSEAVRPPRRKVSTCPAATSGSSGDAPTPPAIARVLPVTAKPFPYGPLIPIRSPSRIAKRAAVASPTSRTVIEDGEERAIGTSSTPGTQTITNCPGREAISRSKTNVLIDGVAWMISFSVTPTGICSSMGAPHDLACVDTVVAVEVLCNRCKDADIVDDRAP